MTSSPDELTRLTALEQGEAVRRGDVSPVELAEHHLALLDDVGAFVTRDAERALAAARALPASGPSPLFGVPTAIKDLNPTAGTRTTFGSAAWHDFVPTFSDNVTLSIEAAGMVWLGKTSTPEFGTPAYTEPDGLPPAVTPWDRTRGAGGSSGGAAAAVAAGLVPVAQGSDGGGSIRIPASCCGIVGLKPSRGRVSGAPTYGDPVGFATAGSLARTVADAAAMLDVLAGHRVGDPTWAPDPAQSFLAATRREPGRLRIARFIAPVLTTAPVDAECVRAWEDASVLLEGLGHEVVDIDVPLPPEARAVFELCWSVLTALSSAPEGREHLLRPLTRWLSAKGRAVSGPEFGLAIGEVRRIAAHAIEALDAFDAVLTPTLATPPVVVGELRDDADPAADFEAQCRFTPWTSAWNVTGMPAVSLPTHWTPEGLPVGVMLAGRPAQDELLLALAAQVESVSNWTGRRPPVQESCGHSAR